MTIHTDSKHTPGPWSRNIPPASKCNLIAAAPELLEALKAVMAKFIGERQFATAEETAIVNQAREAIAKAEDIAG